jgi:adenine deaminase
MKGLIERRNFMNKTTLHRLLTAAKGEEPVDTIITNGRIVNVFTNTIEEGLAVSIRDGYIANIDALENLRKFEKSEVIDAGGRYLCPGFMDAHTHLDTMYPFHEIIPYTLEGGTTTLVSEAGTVATACGIEGLEAFYESTKGHPLRCYFVVPPLTPPFPQMESALGLSLADFEKVLQRDDVLGIGEAYWTRAVDGDERVLEQASLALSLGKTLEGHAAGARGSKLVQYLMTGITSCHESTTVEEAVERLRFGVYVMIREGFVRRELPVLSGLKDLDVDMRRIILVSDGLDAVNYCEEGCLDAIVRRAIEYGFKPMDAIKMTTINVADYYGLRHLGAIAPFRFADILFLDDLEKISVSRVMVDGKTVVSDGKFLGPMQPCRYPESMRHTVRAQKVFENDFRIPAAPGQGRVRIIKVVDATITREAEANLAIKDGYLEKDLSRDILPVAVINRNDRRKMGRGFITGTGLNKGAFATTVTWDTGNILVIGSSEAEMAIAVNRLIELQGGFVICSGNETIFEFPMPIFGYIPECSMEEIRHRTKELELKMAEIGSIFPRPFLNMQTIPFTGLPFLRITDRGLADIKEKKLVPLFL